MTLSGGRPWLLSLGLHGLVVAVILGVILTPGPTAPPAVRMHLVSGGGSAPGATPPKIPSTKLPISSPVKAAPEPQLPSWREKPASVEADRWAVPAPASLDELLPSEASSSSASDSVPAVGWSSPGGQGYTPPPLPPPGLAPPQGARWALTLSVPGGGGFATHVEGLDSGHPALDQWLEKYLRTVSFPSSLDGHDYQLNWVLHLDTGRPQ